MPLKDPEKRKAYDKERYKKQPYKYGSEEKQKRKERYKKDRERVKEQSRSYYANNKLKMNERGKAYRKNNADVVKINKRKYRATKSMVKEHYTKQDETFTLNLFSHKCFNCGSTKMLVIDHVYPLSKGYALSRSNACVLCNSCNCSKHTRLPNEFYSEDKLKELFIILGIIEPPLPTIIT